MKIEECRQIGLRPQNYFYLTELVNPTQAYWDRIRPNVPQPVEILQKLKQGKKLHYLSRYWFARLPEFVASETTYDGQYADIPGVVGRIDYQLGDSILEFKTKDAERVSVEQVLGLYPQDLEQLLFYAAISPSHPDSNYLVFMCFDRQGNPSFHAFRVRIRDFPPIVSELRRRIRELKSRVDNETSADLPKCRYYETGCRFPSPGVCECETARILDNASLLDAITIDEDREFALRIRESYERGLQPEETFDIWDVILPCKWYHRYFGYAEDEELAPIPGFDSLKLARVALVTSAVYYSALGVSRDEKRGIPLEFPEVSGPNRFLKLALPSGVERIVPYTCRVWGHYRMPDESYLAETSVAELALQCARSSSPKGVIVANFPNCGDRTMCYVLTFNLETVSRRLRGTLNRMREAIAIGDPQNLESCPDFMLNDCEIAACICRARKGVA